MNRPSWLPLLGFVTLCGCQDGSHSGLLGTYRIGERTQVGPMIYNVYETQYLVKMGDGAEAKIPKNRFFVIHVSAVNSGAATSDESIPTFSLIDDAGKTFNELDNGANVPQWLGFSRKVRPAESVNGNIVFDVAPKHYKLRIADETDQRYAFVDLPLSFMDPNGAVEGAPDAPTSPTPLSPH